MLRIPLLALGLAIPLCAEAINPEPVQIALQVESAQPWQQQRYVALKQDGSFVIVTAHVSPDHVPLASISWAGTDAAYEVIAPNQLRLTRQDATDFKLAKATVVFEGQTATDAKEIAVIHLTAEARREGTSEWSSGGTVIAAGGLPSPPHVSEIRIAAEPAALLSEENQLQVQLTGGGGGFNNEGIWWWQGDYWRRAKLTIEGATFTHGDESPLAVSSLSEFCYGTVVSSNKVEGTVVSAHWMGQTAETTISFSAGETQITLPDPPSYWDWSEARVVRTFDSIPLPGHAIVLIPTRIIQPDDTVSLALLGNSEESSITLDYQVWLEIERGKTSKSTSGSDGTTTHRVNIQGYKKEIEFRAFDLNSAEEVQQ